MAWNLAVVFVPTISYHNTDQPMKSTTFVIDCFQVVIDVVAHVLHIIISDFGVPIHIWRWLVLLHVNDCRLFVPNHFIVGDRNSVCDRKFVSWGGGVRQGKFVGGGRCVSPKVIKSLKTFTTLKVLFFSLPYMAHSPLYLSELSLTWIFLAKQLLDSF